MRYNRFKQLFFTTTLFSMAFSTSACDHEYDPQCFWCRNEFKLRTFSPENLQWIFWDVADFIKSELGRDCQPREPKNRLVVVSTTEVPFLDSDLLKQAKERNHHFATEEVKLFAKAVIAELKSPGADITTAQQAVRALQDFLLQNKTNKGDFVKQGLGITLSPEAEELPATYSNSSSPESEKTINTTEDEAIDTYGTSIFNISSNFTEETFKDVLLRPAFYVQPIQGWSDDLQTR